MSWLTSLSETYDNFYEGNCRNKIKANPIVPVGFIEKNASFTVYLDNNGNFFRATHEKNNTVLMPSLPSAATRQGKKALPFPLYDELRYTAGDLSDITGQEFENYFSSYIKNLREWTIDENAPCELSLLLNYLERKSLASDLLSCEAVKKNDLGSKNTVKGIVEFKIYNNNLSDYIGLAEIPEIRQSWSERLGKTLGNTGFCYASGETVPIASIHSKLYGNAKLISSKDDQTIFQYKGRFTSASEACTIGYGTSEKAHNTLRWLMDLQGYKENTFRFVAWSKNCFRVIQPCGDFAQLFDEEDEIKLDTAEDYSRCISARLAGFRKNVAYNRENQIFLIGVEQVAKGRMSIDFYSETNGDEYLSRLEKWYEKCCWRLAYRSKSGKPVIGIATPDIGRMGYAVFGKEAMITAEKDSDGNKSITKQVQKFCHDMLSCIAGGRCVPVGYAVMAYHRALTPQSFHDKNNAWKRDEWIECMGIALAMLKCSSKKEEYKLALDTNETDRSYRFGRLLAVADVIEEKTLLKQESNRMTNAVRMFTAMQQHPATAWMNLEEKLIPYMERLYPGKRAWFRELIDSIVHNGPDILSSNSHLTPRFIEGYHNQRYELLYNKKEEENN